MKVMIMKNKLVRKLDTSKLNLEAIQLNTEKVASMYKLIKKPSSNYLCKKRIFRPEAAYISR